MRTGSVSHSYDGGDLDGHEEGPLLCTGQGSGSCLKFKSGRALQFKVTKLPACQMTEFLPLRHSTLALLLDSSFSIRTWTTDGKKSHGLRK